MNKLVLSGMVAMVAMACMISGAALADDPGHDDKGAWHDPDMKVKKMGRHEMSGKVESVDHKTGWIKVKTGEGVLNVHFPADSVKDLKDGEMITVHLSYTRGEEKKGGKMMEREQETEKPMKDGGMMK